MPPAPLTSETAYTIPSCTAVPWAAMTPLKESTSPMRSSAAGLASGERWAARSPDASSAPKTTGHRLLIAERRFSVLDHPNGRRRSEVAGARRLGDLARRAAVFSHPPDKGGDVLPALETFDQHSERVVGVRHHVSDKPASGISLLEPLLELGADVAVRVPATLEQFRPLAE